MPRLLILAAALLLAGGSATAAEESLGPGFDHFYNLEYDPAIAAFEQEIAEHPGEPEGYNHLAQGILYRAMYRAGALESELVTGNNPFLQRAKVTPPAAEERRFDEAIATAIRLAEARIAEEPKNLEAVYALGVAHGLRANYDFLIRKQWREALREFTESRKLQNRVTDADPSFIDAYLVEGVHDYVIGCLPFTWKFFGMLVGIRGDKEGGIRTVERVAREGRRNRVDAMIALAVVYRRERHAEKAIPLLEQLVALFPRNYLFRLEMVQMFGDLGRKEDALRVLGTMDALREEDAPGFGHLPAGKIAYTRGNLLFWYRDFDAALSELGRATAEADRLDLNTAMNAWLRTGQTLDLLGRREKALAAYRRAIEGAPDSDAAREAQRYLKSPYRRAAEESSQ